MTRQPMTPRGPKNRQHAECYIFNSLKTTLNERKAAFCMPSLMAVQGLA